MRKSFMFVFISLMMTSTSIPVHAEPQATEKLAVQPNPNPPYAKWGRLAIQETKKRYPTAKIVDYLHVGRKSISAATAQERFKLWLKQENRQFGVYVSITFDTASERVLAISFEETQR